MSPGASQATVQTAVTLSEALNLVEQQIAERLEPVFDEDFNPDHYDEFRDRAFLYRIAHARFAPYVLEARDLQRISETLERIHFFVFPAPAGGIPCLVTENFRSHLDDRIRSEEHESQRDAHFKRVEDDTFQHVVDEAVVYHTINSTTEVRRCALCDVWYSSEYRGRARFCSATCRKKFNVLSKEPGSIDFRCILGEDRGEGGHIAPMSDFSGLSLNQQGGMEMVSAKALRDRDRMDALACAPCVVKHVPAYSAYVAPVLSTVEKVHPKLVRR